jgi:hypothetical protein
MSTGRLLCIRAWIIVEENIHMPTMCYVDQIPWDVEYCRNPTPVQHNQSTSKHEFEWIWNTIADLVFLLQPSTPYSMAQQWAVGTARQDTLLENMGMRGRKHRHLVLIVFTGQKDDYTEVCANEEMIDVGAQFVNLSLWCMIWTCCDMFDSSLPYLLLDMAHVSKRPSTKRSRKINSAWSIPPISSRIGLVDFNWDHT